MHETVEKKQSGGLSRLRSALTGARSIAEGQALVRTVGRSEVRPNAAQPRKHFDPAKLQELAESVREHSILQPLVVRPILEEGSGARYEILAGERRWRAAGLAGLERIPVVIREVDERTAGLLSMVENLQREDLNAVEETEGILVLVAAALDKDPDEAARTLRRLAELQREAPSAETLPRDPDNVMGEALKTVREVFGSLGKMGWESYVKNRLPILDLPPELLGAVREGGLAYTKARAISRLPEGPGREALLREAVEDGLSVRAIRDRVAAELGEDLGGPGEAAFWRRADRALRAGRKSGAYGDARRRRRLEELVSEMEALLGG